jgi:hypothetical protein
LIDASILAEVICYLFDRCLCLPVSADDWAAGLCVRCVGIGSTGYSQPVGEALEKPKHKIRESTIKKSNPEVSIHRQS